MKIKGRKISEPNREYVVIPRPEYAEVVKDAEGKEETITKSGDIVFVCEAVPNFEEFDALVPQPEPPKKLVPGGECVANLDDKTYKQKMEDYSTLKMDWMFVRSLEATPGLEWESVKATDPTTWKNLRVELKGAGFTEIEVGRILTGVLTANSLNEDKIEAARERFLRGLLQPGV